MASDLIRNICQRQAQIFMKSSFALVLYGIILSYLMKIEEQCKYGDHWMHKTLKNGAIFFLVIAALGLIPQLCEFLNQNVKIVFVLGVLKIAYLVLLILYIWKLKKTQFKSCVDDWRRLGIEIYVYLVFALLLIAFLYPFVVMLMYNTCRVSQALK